jgi:hypothetical protein
MCQRLGFHSETPSCKTTNNLTVDVSPAQAQAFGSINGTRTQLKSFLITSFRDKEIYLNEANSGTEPEKTVHFRNLTCKVGKNIGGQYVMKVAFVNKRPHVGILITFVQKLYILS